MMWDPTQTTNTPMRKEIEKKSYFLTAVVCQQTRTILDAPYHEVYNLLHLTFFLGVL